MSSSPTVPDGPVAQLLDDGYDVVLHKGYLVVRRLPYLAAHGQALDRKLVVHGDGQLILPINESSGELTDAIGDHQIWFAGYEPHDERGTSLGGANEGDLGDGLIRNYTMSFKPPGGVYQGIYHKVRHYVRILRDAAQSVNAGVTASPGAAFQEVEDDLPFVYRDTNTTRAGLTVRSMCFRGHTIAIVGLGGTGSYILDQVAKTPVDRILLIDGDHFDTHNAFRAPGAAAHEVLQQRTNKAEYFRCEYSRMHTGITAHPEALTAENLPLLEDATFVFLAAADARERPAIMSGLHGKGLPFIDVGLGLRDVEAGLTGLMKVVNHFPGKYPSFPIVAATPAGGDDYSTNIQIADLNALNALLAVIQWKKYLGFYANYEQTVETVYKLYVNELRNGEAT